MNSPKILLENEEKYVKSKIKAAFYSHVSLLQVLLLIYHRSTWRTFDRFEKVILTFYFVRFPIKAQNVMRKRTKIPKIEIKAVFIRTCLDFKTIINFLRSSSTTSIDSNIYSGFLILVGFPITAQNFIKKRTKIPKIEIKRSRFHPHVSRFQGYY